MTDDWYVLTFLILVEENYLERFYWSGGNGVGSSNRNPIGGDSTELYHPPSSRLIYSISYLYIKLKILNLIK